MNQVKIHLKDGLLIEYTTSMSETELINTIDANGFVTVSGRTKENEDGTTTTYNTTIFKTAIKYFDFI